MNYAQVMPIVISLCSLVLAAYTFLAKNNKDTTTELTTVIVKLESISSGITDIKAELAGLKSDQRDDHDRLIRLEASIKSAWKQINRMQGVEPEEGGL